MKENLNFIPKKYLERVASLELESDLIDDCKYMLYFTNNWCWEDDYTCLPVRSKKEALMFVKEAHLKEKK